VRRKLVAYAPAGHLFRQQRVSGTKQRALAAAGVV